ncbi:pepF/M3 family oligoendopeptidase [Melghiribacillus thermohalophilus]|uniref:PepF/M3 family oligoendopeptidase n=1 Tax=Melghiribacillus thermohalophilus TaxID=1324956 RepID=A0A4R3MV18_9BACI|nr:M3 family oligoendopeptidase [Melghiribacillus thermohalophilus]TCT20360.1 pepF/M3 family oligoendopeptidase [Melghiribacillus thermohalophilus]
MTITSYSDVWDLDSIFPGGSDSPALRSHVDQLKSQIEDFSRFVQDFTTPEGKHEVKNINRIIDQATEITANLTQASAFVSCLEAQNMADKKAGVLRNELSTINARFSTSFNAFQQKLALTEDHVWQGLLNDDTLSKLSFVLNEWRKKARDKLSAEEESLIASLSVDGYHGWGEMYHTIVGSMSVRVNVEGEDKTLSIGQANNLLSHENPDVRKEVFEKLEEAWKEKEDLFAKTLNHLAGFRLSMYEKRGWNHILKEPLEYNRMKPETLEAMWGAISRHKKPFVKYLERKAGLLGKEQMDWHDLDAPVGKTAKKLSYNEGAQFILKHFEKFGSDLSSFTRKAFEQSWIEAEDRPGKRPGGFCTGFPLSEESRIFMTYSGTMSNVATLAHELGHAYHSYALKSMHLFNRRYAMNVAETASTFAEMIVADAAVREAEKKEEKVAMLDDKLQRSVAFFMNIHARFLFETRFYEERKKGLVPAQRLNKLMEEAQREAYAGALGKTHPRFWASKLHFYITGVPFYNFPYTFGYLFSLSIYARALESGESYEEKYKALLRDTAVMTVEDLAMKHLGENLTEEAFWEKGISLCIKDAEEFLALTK